MDDSRADEVEAQGAPSPDDLGAPSSVAPASSGPARAVPGPGPVAAPVAAAPPAAPPSPASGWSAPGAGPVDGSGAPVVGVPAATPSPATPAATSWPTGASVVAPGPATSPADPGAHPGARPLGAPMALPGYPSGPPPAGPAAAPLAGADLPTDPGGPPRRVWPVALVAALVGALVASVVTVGALALVDDGDGGSALRFDGDALEIREVLDRAQPSVVSINTDQTTTRGVFGGAGSGVVISEDGLVLTNAHVIGGVTRMEVTLHDGRTVSATLVGSSPDDDIALVRIDEPDGLVPAELGSSSDIQVGDEVVAIGNALNLGGPPSVTRGIVSAKDRTIAAPGELVLDNLIQTDAAINPGNSGGPLLNARGQVVGINTAIISDAQNIGFAIAIDPIRTLIEDLRDGNAAITPDGPFLGVSMLDLDEVVDSVRDEYEVTAESGAFVSDLVPDTAATEAGLELGDVIVAIDGQPVTGSDDVAEAIRQHVPGDTITITYERAGTEAETEAVLRTRDEAGG